MKKYVVLMLLIPVISLSGTFNTGEEFAYDLMKKINAGENYGSIKDSLIKLNDYDMIMDELRKLRKKKGTVSQSKRDRERERFARLLLKGMEQWDKSAALIREKKLKFSLRYLKVRVKNKRGVVTYKISITAYEDNPKKTTYSSQAKLYIKVEGVKVKGKMYLLLEKCRLRLPDAKKYK